MNRNLLLLTGTFWVALVFAEFVLRVLKIEHTTQKTDKPINKWVCVPEEMWTEPDNMLQIDITALSK